MLMGDVCTRGCRFCDVKQRDARRRSTPRSRAHLAEAVGRLGLEYLVVTSVEPRRASRRRRFALRPGHRRAAPRRARTRCVEVLTPDFQGSRDALQMIVDARAHVAAHNVETVARLTPRVRDRRATYRQSLERAGVLQAVGGMRTKSSLMLGLGETRDEVLQAMRDLRAVDCDILTLGQYLRPSEKHLPVEEFVRPEEFAQLEREGLALGFRFVAAGPLVRSSYKAGEFFVQRWVGNG